MEKPSMATTTAPLLSFGASGQIAKTMVHASWRGVPYVRRHVVPANPQSTEQTKTRSVFGWLSNVWKNSPSAFQAPWTLFATGQPFTDRNAMIGRNTAAMRAGTDITAMVFSPGAKGGISPTAVSASGGSGSVTVTVTAPTAPTGWTIVAAHAAAIRSQDPHSGVLYTMTAGQDTSAPYSIALTVSAGAYEIGAWLEWTKPDGTTAYSPSTNTTATAT